MKFKEGKKIKYCSGLIKTARGWEKDVKTAYVLRWDDYSDFVWISDSLENLKNRCGATILKSEILTK